MKSVFDLSKARIKKWLRSSDFAQTATLTLKSTRTYLLISVRVTGNKAFVPIKHYLLIVLVNYFWLALEFSLSLGID